MARLNPNFGNSRRLGLEECVKNLDHGVTRARLANNCVYIVDDPKMYLHIDIVAISQGRYLV